MCEERIKKRIKLIIAYDGTNYCGWQIQINGITVEEVIVPPALIILLPQLNLATIHKTA